MRRGLSFLLFVFLPGAFAQNPPAPKPTGVVEGRVINALTSDPIRKARVVLRSPVAVSNARE